MKLISAGCISNSIMIYVISCVENSFVTYQEAFYVTVRTSHIVISDPLSKQKNKKKKMNIKLKIQKKNG